MKNTQLQWDAKANSTHGTELIISSVINLFMEKWQLHLAACIFCKISAPGKEVYSCFTQVNYFTKKIK